MTKIVQSTYTEGPNQADGRRWVYERHVTDDGDTLTFDWLGKERADLVIAARAQNLNQQYAERDAAEAMVTGTKLPLSKLEFRNLFGPKKPAIDAFNTSFETNAALTADQKAMIRTGLLDFEQAKYVRRPFDPAVIQMVGMYQALGLLTAQEAAAVLANG